MNLCTNIQVLVDFCNEIVATNFDRTITVAFASFDFSEKLTPSIFDCVVFSLEAFSFIDFEQRTIALLVASRTFFVAICRHQIEEISQLQVVIVIEVEIVEYFIQIDLIKQSPGINGSCVELVEIQPIVIIQINGLENVIPIVIFE